MEPLKEFVRKMVKDATNRRMLGDSAKLRHILVSGELGTGKSTAAEHICEMLKLTGGIKTHSEEVPEWDDGKWESKAKHACAARTRSGLGMVAANAPEIRAHTVPDIPCCVRDTSATQLPNLSAPGSWVKYSRRLTLAFVSSGQVHDHDSEDGQQGRGAEALPAAPPLPAAHH